MVAITEDAIRRLAGVRGERGPVTSCYLDVDGRRHLRHQDYEQELQQLLRRAEWKVDDSTSVADDFDRIKTYVCAGIDRSGVRGLAMFACSADNFFEVVPLPVPVRSQLVVNAAPAVRQLERVVREYERFGVLLADRQNARMLVFRLGELDDHSELFEALPRNYDSRGERDRGDQQHHVEELAHIHLRHAAEVAFRVYQETGFEHLAIGAPDSIASELEADLHPYLSEIRCERIEVSVGASEAEIRAAAVELESRVERAREDALVQQLREAVARGDKAVVGLTEVLRVLGERRVERLLVSQGYSQAGWMCRSCSRLHEVGRDCAVCGAAMVSLDDVVEEAVEEALAQGCQVDICVGNADLDVLGRIGAVLRF